MSKELETIDEACDQILRVTRGNGGLVADAVEARVRDILEAAHDQERNVDRAHGLGLDAVEHAARGVIDEWGELHDQDPIRGTQFATRISELAAALTDADE